MSNVTINNHDLRINKATKIQVAFRDFKTRRKIVNDVLQTKLDTWVNEASGEREVRLSVKDRIKIINRQFVVNGNLDLKGSQISSLPSPLVVNGKLDLSGSKIRSLPEVLHVSESLGLMCCFELTELHGDLNVQQNLSINTCHNLITIYGGVTVGGTLDADNCINLTTIHEGIKAKKIWLRGCTSLTELPEWMFSLNSEIVISNTGVNPEFLNKYDFRQRAPGYNGPKIMGCFKEANKLSADTQAKFDTWVNETPDEIQLRERVKNKIKIIGGELVVEESLSLSDANISSLPQGLNIWGSLILFGSTIRSLEGLQVSGNLYLNDCASLRELPNWVFRLSRNQTVSALNTGICSRLLADYNNCQNADGYTGPQIEFSINDYRSTSDVRASELPNLVQTITGTKADHPFWQFSATQTETRSLFNYFADFLTRLLNELPSGSNRQSDLDQLSQKLIPLFRKMEAEYDLKNQDFGRCDLINNILSAAKTAIRTCIDKVKVGYLFMQLFLKDDFKVDLNKLSTIIKTVEDIASAQVIFDKSTNQFIHVVKTILNGEFSDELKLQAKYRLKTDDSSIELTDDEMAQLDATGAFLMDKNTLTQHLAGSLEIQNQQPKIISIGDQVEDILNLAYKILSDDFHKINMSFASCCTLKNEIDIGGAQYESAAITYIQQILDEQQNQHHLAITIQKQVRDFFVRRNQSR